MSDFPNDPLPPDEAASGSGSGGAFALTRWSLVRSAQSDAAGAMAALEQLCRLYRQPIFDFIRYRYGHRYGHHDAEDLTQGFFAHLIQQETLKRAAQGQGRRFRTFLLASLNYFIANDWKRQRAVKRGGRCEIVSLDEPTGDGSPAPEPSTAPPEDQVFDRQWALALVARCLDRLQKEHAECKQSRLFERLKPGLTQPETPGLYAAAAPELAMTEGALRVAALRLRERFVRLLKEEVAQTVARPDDVADELRHLLAAATA